MFLVAPFYGACSGHNFIEKEIFNLNKKFLNISKKVYIPSINQSKWNKITFNITCLLILLTLQSDFLVTDLVITGQISFIYEKDACLCESKAIQNTVPHRCHKGASFKLFPTPERCQLWNQINQSVITNILSSEQKDSKNWDGSIKKQVLWYFQSHYFRNSRCGKSSSCKDWQAQHRLLRLPGLVWPLPGQTIKPLLCCFAQLRTPSSFSWFCFIQKHLSHLTAEKNPHICFSGSIVGFPL